MRDSLAPAPDLQESMTDRLAAIAAVNDAPVLWRTSEPGNQTIRISDALRDELSELQGRDHPAHLRDGAEKRASIIRGAIEAIERASGHPHAAAHRQTIVANLQNLPESRWEYDGPAILGAPAQLLPLLDNLAVPVLKKTGLEIRLWDGCGADTICISRDAGHGNRLLHLAGADIPAEHLHLYQMLRDGYWPADICAEISQAL